MLRKRSFSIFVLEHVDRERSVGIVLHVVVVVYSYCTSEGISRCSHFVSASSLHRQHRRSSLNDSFIIDNQLRRFERLHRID